MPQYTSLSAIRLCHPHTISTYPAIHNECLQLNYYIVLLWFSIPSLFILSSSLHCINSHLISTENVPEMQNPELIHVRQITSSAQQNLLPGPWKALVLLSSGFHRTQTSPKCLQWTYLIHIEWYSKSLPFKKGSQLLVT